MALRSSLCGFFATVVVACAATPRAPTEPVPKVHSDPAPSLFEILEDFQFVFEPFFREASMEPFMHASVETDVNGRPGGVFCFAHGSKV